MQKSLMIIVLFLALCLAACGEQAPLLSSMTLDYTSHDDFTFDPSMVELEAVSDVTIHFENAGVLAHNWLLIPADVDPLKATQDDAVAGAFIDNVNGGDNASVTFAAPAAGRYLVVCTVPGHAAGGMVADFVVAGG